MELFMGKRRSCEGGRAKGEWPEQETKPKQLSSGLVMQQQVFAVLASCSCMLVWEQRLFSFQD